MHKFKVSLQLLAENGVICMFIVVNGPFQDRIRLDSDYYSTCLLPNLKSFFFDCVVPELISGDILKQMQSTNVPTDTVSDSVNRDVSDVSHTRFFCPICTSIIKKDRRYQATMTEVFHVTNVHCGTTFDV